MTVGRVDWLLMGVAACLRVVLRKWFDAVFLLIIAVIQLNLVLVW